MTTPAKPGNLKLEDLSPHARAAIEEKKVIGGWDARSLIKLMGELERWDNVAEARKSRAQKYFIGACVGCVVGFFLMFVIGAIFENFFLGVLFFLVPFILLFVALRKKKAARSIDLPDELRISLKPVLRQLYQDIHPEEKIKVTLNLACIDGF